MIKIPVCTSTQDVAKELAEKGTEDMTVIVAEDQTAGRGRQGKTWASSVGGLWTTIVLRREVSLDLVPYIALASGLAIKKALLETTGVNATIKYPNDLLFGCNQDWKKLCGILCQSSITSGQLRYVLVGVGLNVNNKPPSYAISLKQITRKEHDLEPMAKIVSEAVSSGTLKLVEHGKMKVIKDLLDDGAIEMPLDNFFENE
ncbi:MAG: biotin--[acetyl-CoA-carboxylase] ligase [Caldisericales bacterium]|nr:biotin--[acetyl-CoA-carboxylase] ligase [Caldisericales bacterium]